VITGKQSIDSDNGQVAQMLAGLLSWSQGTFAAKININAEKTDMTVDRETDTGIETVNLKLPAVISADLRLNEPRYASLPNIMKAKKKPIETLAAEKVLSTAELTPHLTVLKVEEPSARKAGRFVENVDALINALKNEAKVI
jgi:electron transfer flavoprotein beta subunit